MLSSGAVSNLQNLGSGPEARRHTAGPRDAGQTCLFVPFLATTFEQGPREEDAKPLTHVLGRLSGGFTPQTL